MRRPAPRLIRFALLCALAAVSFLLIAASPALALGAVPVIAIFGALVAGAFPGEELIDRLRERRAVPAPRRRGGSTVRTRRAVYVRPVGRAATFALAMRPPPAAAARA